MSHKLREYQDVIIRDARSQMISGIKSILIQAPTGSGKTLLTAHMLKTAAAKGMHSWFCVHRRELIKQSIEAFKEEGIPFGVVASGFQHNNKHIIQIASIQTLVRRLDYLTPPKLIVFDEAHHTAAGSWMKIYNRFKDAFHIGLTATPSRLDGKGLGDLFKSMIAGPSVRWLIDNKFLADYKIFAPSTVNLSGVHTRMGDYANNELAKAVDKPAITGNAIEHYKKHADGKRAVVFCASIAHSKHVVEQFNAAGIKAVHVDGETDIQERDQSIRRFRSGEIKILSNVELFGEGFDLPALEVAILLRPTQSLGLYLQQVGRVLRPSYGKETAIILDHAGNCQRHGLPDEERIWSLAGTERSARNSGSNTSESVRVCPKCFAAQITGIPSCRHCGFTFEVKSRQIEEKEGSLEEVDTATIRLNRKREQGAAQTLDDLVRIGKERGYKRPYSWAHYILQARQHKKIYGGSTPAASV